MESGGTVVLVEDFTDRRNAEAKIKEQLDQALEIYPRLIEFLRQPIAEKTAPQKTFETLLAILTRKGRA